MHRVVEGNSPKIGLESASEMLGKEEMESHITAD